MICSMGRTHLVLTMCLRRKLQCRREAAAGFVPSADQEQQNHRAREYLRIE